MTDSPKGLAYWLTWIEALKKWVFAAPAGIYSAPAYTVNEVPYADLHALAAHFKLQVAPEDKRHQQWVFVEVWHGMSMTQVLFKSPKRKFTYAPLPKP